MEPAGPQLALRTEVRLADLGLAFAAGVAGTLSYTTAAPTSLVGVMVAVALLPPLVSAGLFAGAGHWPEAGRAGLLTLVNLIAIDLASVITFLAQGIRPHQWWQEEKAKTATRRAVALWGLLLAALGLVVYLACPGAFRDPAPPDADPVPTPS